MVILNINILLQSCNVKNKQICWDIYNNWATFIMPNISPDGLKTVILLIGHIQKYKHIESQEPLVNEKTFDKFF